MAVIQLRDRDVNLPDSVAGDDSLLRSMLARIGGGGDFSEAQFSRFHEGATLIVTLRGLNGASSIASEVDANQPTLFDESREPGEADGECAEPGEDAPSDNSHAESGEASDLDQYQTVPRLSEQPCYAESVEIDSADDLAVYLQRHGGGKLRVELLAQGVRNTTIETALERGLVEKRDGRLCAVELHVNEDGPERDASLLEPSPIAEPVSIKRVQGTHERIDEGEPLAREMSLLNERGGGDKPAESAENVLEPPGSEPREPTFESLCEKLDGRVLMVAYTYDPAIPGRVSTVARVDRGRIAVLSIDPSHVTHSSKDVIAAITELIAEAGSVGVASTAKAATPATQPRKPATAVSKAAKANSSRNPKDPAIKTPTAKKRSLLAKTSHSNKAGKSPQHGKSTARKPQSAKSKAAGRP